MNSTGDGLRRVRLGILSDHLRRGGAARVAEQRRPRFAPAVRIGLHSAWRTRGARLQRQDVRHRRQIATSPAVGRFWPPRLPPRWPNVQPPNHVVSLKSVAGEVEVGPIARN